MRIRTTTTTATTAPPIAAPGEPGGVGLSTGTTTSVLLENGPEDDVVMWSEGTSLPVVGGGETVLVED